MTDPIKNHLVGKDAVITVHTADGEVTVLGDNVQKQMRAIDFAEMEERVMAHVAQGIKGGTVAISPASRNLHNLPRNAVIRPSQATHWLECSGRKISAGERYVMSRTTEQLEAEVQELRKFVVDVMLPAKFQAKPNHWLRAKLKEVLAARTYAHLPSVVGAMSKALKWPQPTVYLNSVFREILNAVEKVENIDD